MSANAEKLQIDVRAYMRDAGKRARAASRLIGRADTGVKNHALIAIADGGENGRGGEIEVRSHRGGAGRVGIVRVGGLARIPGSNPERRP